MCITNFEQARAHAQRVRANEGWLEPAARKALYARLLLMAGAMVNRDRVASEAAHRILMEFRRGAFDDPEFLADMEQWLAEERGP